MRIDQRRASRVPCELPARVYGRVTDLHGEVRDMSRTGVLLCVSLPSSSAPLDDLQYLARAVEQYIGPDFKVDLNYVQAGSPLRKQLRVVRLGQATRDDGQIEIGCEFDTPLTDDEVWQLGVNVPSARTTVMPSPSSHRPGRRFGAYLLPSAGWSTPMMTGTTDGLHDRAVVFCADRNAQFNTTDDDVTTLTLELARAYGPEPVLEIVHGHRQMWKGRTRIRKVEALSSRSRRMRIWVEPDAIA